VHAGSQSTHAVPFVNVLDYGAIPNDGKSDVAAIHRAIRAAASGAESPRTAGTGGTVYFPPGVYSIDSTIALNGLGSGEGRRDGVRLLGASGSAPRAVSGGAGGTVLQAIPGISGPVIRGDVARVSIEHLTLDGNALANPVLQFWYLSTGITVQNVVLTGARAAAGRSCLGAHTCTSLVELDGTRSAPDACRGGACSPPMEVDNIVFQNVLFASTNISDYDVDVEGSNTFRIMVRDSRLTSANDLVRVVAGSIDLDNDDLAPAPTGNGSIRVDSLVQHMTVSNCYTEVTGPKFFYQGSVQEHDGPNVVRIIDNQVNANAPIVFVPNQMMVLDGNVLKGNVEINEGGKDYGKQSVIAVGNQFGAHAYFSGTGQGQIQQIGTASTTGEISSVLSTLRLSGPTSVAGLLRLQPSGQVAYRITTGDSRPHSPPQEFSPLHWDEVHAPKMTAPVTWTVDGSGATPGVRMRFVKTSTDKYPITIAQKNGDGTLTRLTTLNSTPGATGWVELTLLSGSPNDWAVSAWGKN
jgi:hypothetical protein